MRFVVFGLILCRFPLKGGGWRFPFEKRGGGLSTTPSCIRYIAIYLNFTIRTGLAFPDAGLRKYTPAASPSPIFSPLYVPTILPEMS